MNLKIIVLTILIFSFNLLFADSQDKKSKSFIDIINKYRPYMLKKLNDTTLFFVENKTRKRGIELLKEPLSKSGNIKEIKENILFDIIAYLSPRISIRRSLGIEPCCTVAGQFYFNIRSFRTGFIEDEKLYYFWVELFNCDDFSIKEWVYHKILLKGSRNDYLKKYSAEIKQGIIDYRIGACERDDRESCKKLCQQNVDYKDIKEMLPGDELLILLPLSDKEKEMILKKIINKYKDLPHGCHLRARLGDKKAEERLIGWFERANKLDTKVKLADRLGIAGTPECARALVRALNSHVERLWNNGSYKSSRISIIKALGRIHPEVSFLRTDVSFIEKCGDKGYGGKDKTQRYNKIQSYLDKVISWSGKKYHIKPIDKAPEPIMSIERIFISPSPSSNLKISQ